MLDLPESLTSFVTYVQAHLTGDEKGEAADFIDHLFRSLGHEGIKEAGATREYRVANVILPSSFRVTILASH